MNTHPKLTEQEKAYNEGAASMSASYWPRSQKHDLFCPICQANLTDSEHAADCSRASAAKIIVSNEQLESARNIERNRIRKKTEGEKYAKLWEQRHDLLASVRWILERLERGGKAASSDAMQQARAAIARTVEGN